MRLDRLSLRKTLQGPTLEIGCGAVWRARNANARDVNTSRCSNLPLVERGRGILRTRLYDRLLGKRLASMPPVNGAVPMRRRNRSGCDNVIDRRMQKRQDRPISSAVFDRSEERLSQVWKLFECSWSGGMPSDPISRLDPIRALLKPENASAILRS